MHRTIVHTAHTNTFEYNMNNLALSSLHQPPPNPHPTPIPQTKTHGSHIFGAAYGRRPPPIQNRKTRIYTIRYTILYTLCVMEYCSLSHALHAFDASMRFRLRASLCECATATAAAATASADRKHSPRYYVLKYKYRMRYPSRSNPVLCIVSAHASGKTRKRNIASE